MNEPTPLDEMTMQEIFDVISSRVDCATLIVETEATENESFYPSIFYSGGRSRALGLSLRLYDRLRDFSDDGS